MPLLPSYFGGAGSAAVRRSLVPRRSALASGLLALTFGATAGTLTTDFTSDPGGLALASSPNSVLVDEGVLKLVDLQDLADGLASLPLQGSYIFPEIDSGKVASFRATFKARVGGGTERSSQGFCLVLANDYSETAPFREAGGSTTGLTVSFDVIDGRPGASTVTEGNEVGAAPGIIVKQGGKTVTFRKFDGLRTGAGFVPVEVKLDDDGTLDVTYNGTKVFDNVPIGYVPIAGRFGLGAGTEETTSANRDNFWIDDLSITTTTVSGAHIASVQPPTRDAGPDAVVEIGVQDLGAGTVAMKFDGAEVTPTRSTSGNVTLLRYDPPGLLAPGSSHTLELTYGGKTFSYAFAVANSPVVPPSAALAANAVDTTRSGFKVRVHQTETAAPGGNTAARVEGQLAGLYGDNTADLSGANPDGTFDRDVINMEQDGIDGGLMNSTNGKQDELIPGIPGSTGTTDNIAMEIRGYLELQPGAYTIGGVSDDNLKFTIGADPRDATALKLFETAIGTVRGSFIVQQAGIYPVRAIWGEGGGGAHVELWAENAAGDRILLNDRSTAGHLKSYRQRAAGYQEPPYLSSASPLPDEINVSTQPKIRLELTDSAATVTASSIKLSIDGQPVTLSAGNISKAGKVTTVTYQPAAALDALASHTLKVEFADNTGRAIVREYTFTTGKAAAGSVANTVKGYWTFDKGNLSATVGRDLQYIDSSLSSRYAFGTTTQLGISPINGQEARVLHIPYTPGEPKEVFSKIGLRLQHGIAPNGGGKKVNQWTLIMDVLWGPNGQGFGGLLQTHDFDNPTDGDMFWRKSDGSYGKGCCSSYDGVPADKSHKEGTWARVVFVADIAANPPRFAKFINGYKHLETVTGDGGSVDGRFALPPEFFVFGDGDDNERTEAYVNAIQIREGALTDDEVVALGAANAAGIPIPYAQWDFDKGNLAATVGSDLQFIDSSLSSRYAFGTTTQLGIPAINGQEAKVLHIPYTPGEPREVFSKIGLRVNHGLGINGGGQKLNQWTLVMDVLWGPNGQGFGGLLQTHDLANPTDGDMFWRKSDGSYGKGCCSSYDGVPADKSHKESTWARVVFVADMTSSPPRLAKFINGYKHLETVTGDGGTLDGRFALPSEFFLFGDGDDNERTEAYVNSIQLQARALTDDEVIALGVATAAGIPTPNPVKGEWNFDQGNLAATVGADLQYIDASLASRYKFGTTAELGISPIAGQNARVLFIPYTPGEPKEVFSKIGLRVNHGILANGGGQKVNQWSLIMDVLWGPNGQGFGGLLQTHDFANPTDGDMFWRKSDGSYGKGCCSSYDGVPADKSHKEGEWARVVFVADIAANPPRLAKFINGYKHLETVTGDGGSIDGRFALPSEFFLFGDGDDNERTEAYVNAIQIREGAMTDDEVVALGGASAFGIPGAAAGAAAPAPVKPPTLTVTVNANGSLTLSWTGSGFTLESTPGLPGGWSAVAGVTGTSATVPTTDQARFYRLRK